MSSAAPALLPQSQIENLFGHVDLRGVSAPDADNAYKLLQFGGPEAVLETVAMGRLLSELAVQLVVPVRWLDTWVEKNVDGSELARAYRLGAETLVAKSLMVLSMDVNSGHEAAQARALADRMLKLAEQLDSQRWGAKRADGLAGQNVSITMNLGGGKTVTSTAEVEDAEIVVEPPATTGLTTRRVDPINLSCALPEGEVYG